MTVTSFQGKLAVWEASVFYVGLDISCLFPISRGRQAVVTTEVTDSRNLDYSLSGFQSAECSCQGRGYFLARPPPVGLCLLFPLYLPTFHTNESEQVFFHAPFIVFPILMFDTMEISFNGMPPNRLLHYTFSNTMFHTL